MKRILALSLALLTLLGLSACGGTTADEGKDHTHIWSSWHTSSPALVGRPGTEKRICGICSELETRPTTSGDYVNSFMDDALNYFFEIGAGHDMYIGENLVPTNIVQSYIALIITRQNDYKAQAVIPATDYVALAQKYFVLDEDALFRLNPEGLAQITVPYQDPVGGLYEVTGYRHQENNIYTVYFANPYGSVCFEVELEYNLLNDQPNRYIRIERITQIPQDIIQ